MTIWVSYRLGISTVSPVTRLPWDSAVGVIPPQIVHLQRQADDVRIARVVCGAGTPAADPPAFLDGRHRAAEPRPSRTGCEAVLPSGACVSRRGRMLFLLLLVEARPAGSWVRGCGSGWLVEGFSPGCGSPPTVDMHARLAAKWKTNPAKEHQGMTMMLYSREIRPEKISPAGMRTGLAGPDWTARPVK